eukprot:m.43691 g.43691  ORF g.43691 m.43691 type:complete len:176 (-) comp9996_c0_seq1:25-552(-)
MSAVARSKNRSIPFCSKYCATEFAVPLATPTLLPVKLDMAFKTSVSTADGSGKGSLLSSSELPCGMAGSFACGDESSVFSELMAVESEGSVFCFEIPPFGLVCSIPGSFQYVIEPLYTDASSSIVDLCSASLESLDKGNCHNKEFFTIIIYKSGSRLYTNYVLTTKKYIYLKTCT